MQYYKLQIFRAYTVGYGAKCDNYAPKYTKAELQASFLKHWFHF